jgi:glutamate---cysteine ligase / carboxylate-amine ligase
MSTMEFKASRALTMGVELELQVLNRRDCDLTRGADDLIALIERRGHPGDVKPEITEGMLEVSTGVHERYGPLAAELVGIRDAVVASADRLNLIVAGGGTHPFQRWSDRKIFDRPRFHHLSNLYGYLAKQFTVFGQHVHIGCAEGDSAVYLLHALSRYIPHFIALAASSPYYQGVDTAFDSARLNSIFAFPLSGRAPWVERWDAFVAYFEKMRGYRIVESMKDFYWDIRPKPVYGTIEIRVFDTPLTVERAAMLAAYAQTLSRYLLVERPPTAGEEIYHVYNYNRFQACRFGFEGFLIDPLSQSYRPIREDIIETVAALALHARELESTEAIRQIERWAREGTNDARWLRERYAVNESLEDVVWQQSRRWSGRD